jgi:peroxiredoxin Q/BCP
MTALKVGDRAPAFALSDQSGAPVRLADFKGEKVLVYFYPKANTPGCTAQACSVRDEQPKLGALGIRAVGISPDKPPALEKFDAKYDLGFPLLSDPDHQVAEAFGAWGERVRFGKKAAGIIRSAFLLDEAGRVLAAFVPVKPDETVPKVKAALDSD